VTDGSAASPALRRFLWGTATSAFQMEGGPHSDWATWRIRDEADRAARRRGVGHLDRTDEDLALLPALGVNAYRFSIEWSRIVPRRGAWERREMDRYVRIAARLREAGIEPMVTLHHFSNPAWLCREQAWESPETGEEFLRFAERAVRALRGQVRLWVTFNEPNVYVTGGYLGGLTPPGKKRFRDGFAAYANILRTHGVLYDLIHAQATELPAVGIAHNMVAFHPASPRSTLDGWAARLAHAFYNVGLIEAFRTGTLALRLPFVGDEAAVGVRDKLDFLGVNYYFRLFLKVNPFSPSAPEWFWEDRSGKGLSETGWESYPKGFEEVLQTAALAGVPIVVTENGTAESDDDRKIAYMKDHLRVVRKLAREGTDIRGYFWWSLMDNYEWLEGLRPRFGLYRVDFDTLDRRCTAAADAFARWIARHPDPRIPPAETT
jgi:beta-glucosidase